MHGQKFSFEVIANGDFNFHIATEFVMNQLAPLIPGEPWQGKMQE